MIGLEKDLNKLYKKVVKKIYLCKTLHITYNMKDDHKSFLMQQSILTIYASWEGFLKESLSLYLKKLNSLNLKFNELNQNCLAYYLEDKYKFKNPKTDFTKIVTLSNDLLHDINSNIEFNPQIDTKSNTNFKVTNNLLKQLNLTLLQNKYKNELNKLLKFRGFIAHGDKNSPAVNEDLIEDFSLLIQNLASEIILSILDGVENKKYLQQKEN